MVQWLRHHTPNAGARVQSQVGNYIAHTTTKDPTCYNKEQGSCVPQLRSGAVKLRKPKKQINKKPKSNLQPKRSRNWSINIPSPLPLCETIPSILHKDRALITHCSNSLIDVSFPGSFLLGLTFQLSHQPFRDHFLNQPPPSPTGPSLCRSMHC